MMTCMEELVKDHISSSLPLPLTFSKWGCYLPEPGRLRGDVYLCVMLPSCISIPPLCSLYRVETTGSQLGWEEVNKMEELKPAQTTSMTLLGRDSVSQNSQGPRCWIDWSGPLLPILLLKSMSGLFIGWEGNTLTSVRTVGTFEKITMTLLQRVTGLDQSPCSSSQWNLLPAPLWHDTLQSPVHNSHFLQQLFPCSHHTHKLSVIPHPHTQAHFWHTLPTSC